MISLITSSTTDPWILLKKMFQMSHPIRRRVWRYQRGNQNLYIEEEQTPQWKGQKYKQWSTKLKHKTKDRVARTPIKTGGELRCSGRVNSFPFTSGTRRVNLITSVVICFGRHIWFKIPIDLNSNQRRIKVNKKILTWVFILIELKNVLEEDFGFKMVY